jgi:hypothetical protein
VRVVRVCPDDQRGAAAVEAALVISFLLVPLLVGVVKFGFLIWDQQKQPPYDARIAPSEIVGRFDCAQLVERVRTTVVDNSAALATPLAADSVVVDVVEAAPTVGVLVEVRVNVPEASGSGPLVAEAASRLDHVTLTTETCM